MTSYQRQKLKIKELESEIQKMLSDPEYLTIRLIEHGIKKDVAKRIWFGNSNPTGKIKYR